MKNAGGNWNRQTFHFTPEDIDAASTFISENLAALGMDRRDILRNRLSVEEVLLNWRDTPGLENGFTVEISRRFRRVSLAVKCKGAAADPLPSSEESDLLERQLLNNMGLGFVWHYRDGVNTVSCSQKLQRKIGQFQKIALSLILALMFGGLGLLLPEIWREYILSSFLEPVFDTFLGMFSCIVGPMVFISMVWGIVNIGDTRQVGIIGKKLLSRFLLVSAFFSALALCASLVWFHPAIDQGAGDSSVLRSIVVMVLDIVPRNIIDPLLSGNTLQILFMGMVVGIGMLLLRNQMQVMNAVVEQSNAVVQLILSAIGEMVPGFIFLAVLLLMLRGEMAANAAGLVRLLVLSLILFILNIALHVLSLLRKGLRPLDALRRLLPTALVALTTASSAAAYPVNVDCCENRLGISPSLTRFAIPLGSVVFMPQTAMTLVYVPLFAATLYGVNLSADSLILCAISAVVLSVAMPPIPGGGVACYTLMFLQLGIPLEAISIAITADTVLDFIDTCGNLLGLQVQLVHGAKDLGLLDQDILRSGDRKK